MPVATRWLSVLTMVREFLKADKQLVADTLALHAGHKIAKLQELYEREVEFRAYINVVEKAELPLKILEVFYNAYLKIIIEYIG